jgi:GAF domain-containing protein
MKFASFYYSGNSLGPTEGYEVGVRKLDLITTSACLDCSIATTQIGDPRQLAQHVIAYLNSNLSYQRGAVILKRQSDDRPLIFAHCPGVMAPQEFAREIDRLNRLIERKTNGVVHTVLESGREIMLGDVTRCRNYIAADSAMRSEACFPLMVRNRCIGVLNFENATPDFFTGDDAVLLKLLSTQLALHIDGARAGRRKAVACFR